MSHFDESCSTISAVQQEAQDGRGLFEAAIGDGRPLLLLTGVVLILCGGFALFQSATGQFLPQDVAYLGMTARDLCAIHQCRIVHFMFHDRVSFGGSLIALGSLYLWMAEFPLRQRQAWAWWLFVISGLLGFATFLSYLGYGYLDTWRGVANPRLVPLIAHDRAGFGGGLFSTGIVVFFCVWCGKPSRSLWQVLCVAGIAGFGTAIGIHLIHSDGVWQERFQARR
jgi:hypothetical protein